MPVTVIYNPNADLGHGMTHLPAVRDALRSLDKNAQIVLTEGPGHAQQLVREAIMNGADMVVAAGGDGTVNEVVNGLLTAPGERPLLGVIPIGTGNDFAYAMGIASDVPTAVQNLYRQKTRKADVALMEDDRGGLRYFENNLGVGFDANVVIRTEEITQVHGFLKYLLGVLTTLALDFRPINLELRFDDEEVEQALLFISLGIGQRHGGGFLLTPFASHLDDKIDSCAVTMLSRLRALTLLNSAMKGTHVNVSQVTMRQNRRVEITSAEAMPIHIDGEIYARPQDDIHHLTVTSLPEALDVLV
jgi:YegS/Rv2252/BmrU family lipid kinase